MTEVTHRKDPICPMDTIRTTVSLADGECVRINAKDLGREVVIFSTLSDEPMVERKEFGIPVYIVVCVRRR